MFEQQNPPEACSSNGVRTGLESRVTDDALRRAYVRHWPKLVRLCALLVHDHATAEDIVQDVFIRARGKLQRMNDDETYAYLRRAVLNGWKNHLRQTASKHHTLSRLSGPETPPSEQFEERDALWNSIVALPERQRAVVVLRFYEQLPDVDIAELLHCSRVTVRSQAKRGLAKLREAIDRET